VETIKRQDGTVCRCLAVRLARVCGLRLQPIGSTSALACENSAMEAAVAASGAI